MSKSVFQACISWKVVEAKWPDIRQAFQDFEPTAVANFTEEDPDALTNDRRVIRNRRTLEGIVENARLMTELAKRHEDFHNYLRSHGEFEKTGSDLRKQFRFLGNIGAYHFPWVVNKEVPSYEYWCDSRGRTPMTTSH